MTYSIDVVIPLFNKGRFVETAIRSVIRQTVPCRQIIVADDCSSDEGPAIVRKLSEEEPRLRLLFSPYESPSGPSAARNRGIAAGGSTFVAFLDADDFWESQKLELQLSAFRDPAIGLVHCGYNSVDEAGRLLKSEKAKPVPENAFDAIRLGIYPVTGSASGVVMRRSVLEEVGGFPEHLCFGEDWDLWARAAGSSSIANVPDPLVNIRSLPSFSKSLSRADEYMLWLKVFDRWVDDKSFVQTAIVEGRKRIVSPQVELFWQRRFFQLFFGLYIRTKREGGALGPLMYQNILEYWICLRTVAPHIIHPILARLREPKLGS